MPPHHAAQRSCQGGVWRWRQRQVGGGRRRRRRAHRQPPRHGGTGDQKIAWSERKATAAAAKEALQEWRAGHRLSGEAPGQHQKRSQQSRDKRRCRMWPPSMKRQHLSSCRGQCVCDGVPTGASCACTVAMPLLLIPPPASHSYKHIQGHTVLICGVESAATASNGGECGIQVQRLRFTHKGGVLPGEGGAGCCAVWPQAGCDRWGQVSIGLEHCAGWVHTQAVGRGTRRGVRGGG